MAVAEFKAALLPVTSTFLEAWTEFQHATSRDECESLINRWKPEEVSSFLKSPDTERLVRNTAFAFFRPEDYPTHDMLQQMMLVAPFPEHDRDEINHIATLLAPWNEQRLVCGHSTLFPHQQNCPLQFDPHPGSQSSAKGARRVSHRQPWPPAHRRSSLAASGSASSSRKSLARSTFRAVNNLWSEFYAQLSKFSTWIISVVQQYSRFRQSGIRPIVFGNAKQFFTRMNDRRDVEDVARDIELSQATKEAITRYPLPEHLPPQNKYAALTYYHLDVQQPLCGTIQNRVSPEMLFCSSSTGEELRRTQPEAAQTRGHRSRNSRRDLRSRCRMKTAVRKRIAAVAFCALLPACSVTDALYTAGGSAVGAAAGAFIGSKASHSPVAPIIGAAGGAVTGGVGTILAIHSAKAGQRKRTSRDTTRERPMPSNANTGFCKICERENGNPLTG